MSSLHHESPNPGLPLSTRLESVRQTLDEANISVSQLQECQTRCDILMNDAGPEDAKVDDRDVEELVELDRGLQHLHWVDALQNLAKKVQSLSMEESDTQKGQLAVSSHVDDLIGAHKRILSIVSHLKKSKCKNLRSYATNVLIFTRIICINSWENELTSILVALKYPQFITGRSTDHDISVEKELEPDVKKVEVMKQKASFVTCYKALIALKIEDEEILSTLPEELRKCNPVRILLQPFEKRFKYHFMGKNKKTNDPSKPEWYLQQIASWIRDSKSFFVTFVNPAKSESNAIDFSEHAKFCKGLLDLVNEKLHRELPNLIDDDILLSHLIDEVLIITKGLYSGDLSSKDIEWPLESLVRSGSLFDRWMDLERKFAFEKIDELMMKEGSWDHCEREEYFHVSKFTESFVALIQSITNRFKLLRGADHQKKFVELQCELVEDMRLRLAQIVRQEQAYPLSEKFCLILGSSQYLIDVLKNWNILPMFLRLQLEAGNITNESGIFSKVINEFDFFVNDLVTTLSEHIFYEVKAQGKRYRREVRWFSFTLQGDDDVSPSPECYGMFQVLCKCLEYVNKYLNVVLVNEVVCRVCDSLGNFFIVDVILENKFSSDGCKQISADISKGAFCIFDQYNVGLDHKKSKTYHQVSQVSKLLLLKKANAVLLLETLTDSRQINNVPHILEEFGIDALNQEQAIKILRQRVELL